MKSFRTGKCDVMVCTNVAARGIDVEGVRHVINFDCPGSMLDYQHRIGRTGRAGKSGVATTFLTQGDEAIFFDLKNFLVENRQEVPNSLFHHPAARNKVLPGEKKQEKKGVIFSS